MDAKTIILGSLGLGGLLLAWDAWGRTPGPQPPVPTPPLPSPPVSPRPSLVNQMVTVKTSSLPDSTLAGLENAVGSMATFKQIPGHADFLEVLVTGEMGDVLTGKVAAGYMNIIGMPTLWKESLFSFSANEALSGSSVPNHSISFPRGAVVAAPPSLPAQTLPQHDGSAGSFTVMVPGHQYVITEKPANWNVQDQALYDMPTSYTHTTLNGKRVVGVGSDQSREVTVTYDGDPAQAGASSMNVLLASPNATGVFVQSVFDLTAQEQVTTPNTQIVPFSKI